MGVETLASARRWQIDAGICSHPDTQIRQTFLPYVWNSSRQKIEEHKSQNAHLPQCDIIGADRAHWTSSANLRGKSNEVTKAPEKPQTLASTDDQAKLIGSASAPLEQKFDAMRALTKAGVKEIKIGDASYRLQVTRIDAQSEYVHLWKQVQNGGPQIALRAVYRRGPGTSKDCSSADGGHYEREAGRQGKVDYAGIEFARRSGTEDVGRFGKLVSDLPQEPKNQTTDTPKQATETSKAQGTGERTAAIIRSAAEPQKSTEKTSGERRLEAHDISSASAEGKYRKASDLQKFWTVQPDGNTCGPASLAMAIADVLGKVPPTLAEILQIAKESGTNASGGFPLGTWINGKLPNGYDDKNVEYWAKQHGLNAKSYGFKTKGPDEMAALDAELEQGHRAVALSRFVTGGGHFIYIAGKTDKDHYLVGDPANWSKKAQRPLTRKELETLLQGDFGWHPTFTAVW
jgi:hypothetical protein